MINLNEFLRGINLIDHFIFDLHCPQTYVATSLNDFINDQSVISTKTSLFEPKKNFKNAALIIFDSPLKFKFLGKIRGTNHPDGYTLVGKLNHFKTALPVLANAKCPYHLSAEEYQKLQKSPTLYQAMLYHNCQDDMDILLGYELNEDIPKLDKDPEALLSLEKRLLSPVFQH